MSKFWEYFGQSLILQGLLTVMVMGTICYLYLTTGDCPTALMGVGGVIVGYFFKAKGRVQIIDHRDTPEGVD